MNKRSVLALVAVAGIISAVGPVLIALELANRESLQAEQEQAFNIATEVLRRSEETSDQMDVAFQKLERAHASEPCSDASIARMSKLGLGLSRIHMVGYGAGGYLICSSLGQHVPPIPLGVPDYQAKSGGNVYNIYISAELTLAPGHKFLIAERNGYTVVIDRDLPLDVLTTQFDVSIGLIGQRPGKLLMNRGVFNPEWIVTLGDKNQVKIFDGKNIVAIRRSQKYDYAAYAVLPVSRLAKRIRHFAYLLVPLGIAFSGMLVAGLVFFTRCQLSPKSALQAALRNDEFFMEYQPIIDLQTGTWVGVEALARWRRADGTMIRPDYFIPVAEEHHLIQRVTARVLTLVMQDMPEMLRIDPDFYISINLSSADLQSEVFVVQLRDGLHNAGLRPENLHIEATERGFLNTDVGRRVIRDIRAMGVQVAIDDFGTGYSSLSYLESFDLDYLKIDKSFVDTMGLNAVTSQIALHIIGIAKSLGLQMIAEGVESEVQAQCLRLHGVQYGQGWLFGKPMSSGDIVRKLVAFQSAAVSGSSLSGEKQ